MTKRLNTARKARGKAMKKRLGSLLRRIGAILDALEVRTSIDAENLIGCLVEAKLKIETAQENYCDYI